MDKGYPEVHASPNRARIIDPGVWLAARRSRSTLGRSWHETGPRRDPRREWRAELHRFAEVDAESFAGSPRTTWAGSCGRPYAPLRLAHMDGEIVGGYMLLPGGQFFGGKSVPAQAVTAVAVHPAWRRRGVAGALMTDGVRLAREMGAALAPLHAATVRLYRRWGWEVCALTPVRLFETSALTGFLFRRRDRPEQARPYRRRGDAPRPPRALGRAARSPRLVPLSGRCRPTPRRPATRWLVDEDRLTGYVRYSSSRDGEWVRIRVQEFIFTTEDALRGLLGFLGGQESMSREVAFGHSAMIDASPLVWLLPEPHRTLETQAFLCWMQRIVDIGAAMSARGWPARAAGRAELEVTDPVTGVERFVLEVESGTAQSHPGGSGTIRCGIGALSAWYSSALRAQDAMRLGLLEGEASAVGDMDGLIAGGLPWMPDFF